MALPWEEEMAVNQFSLEKRCNASTKIKKPVRGHQGPSALDAGNATNWARAVGRARNEWWAGPPALSIQSYSFPDRPVLLLLIQASGSPRNSITIWGHCLLSQRRFLQGTGTHRLSGRIGFWRNAMHFIASNLTSHPIPFDRILKRHAHARMVAVSGVCGLASCLRRRQWQTGERGVSVYANNPTPES